MGFSTIVSQVIFFSFILVVLAGVFIISKNVMLENRDSLDAKKDVMYNKINTVVDIQNVSYSGGIITVKVKNEGKTTLNTDYLDFYVNQSRLDRSTVTVTILNPDINNPGLWDPQETIQASITQTLGYDNYSLDIVTEYSSKDSTIFEVQ